ncbi:MAG TPA: SDR family oxidoreductase [Candidatus Competibacter sp.]|nr:SDR family oxidoreductase [Candidatus Competibacter sp.]
MERESLMQPSSQGNPFSVQGKRVLVIGGTRGIGRAIALQFARAGAEVVVNFVREQEAAESLCVEAARSGLQLHAVRADVTSDKALEQLVTEVAQHFPDISTLVFAAATGVHRKFEQLSSRHFDFTFALNVRAFLALVRLLAPKMSPGSSIIALSSEGAERVMPQYGLVGASKGALESLCRHLAVELADRGVRVNILSPGTVKTDAWNALPDADRRLREAISRSPIGRLVTVEEVALAAQFLACDASAGVIGHTLVVDGGARIVGSA